MRQSICLAASQRNRRQSEILRGAWPQWLREMKSFTRRKTSPMGGSRVGAKHFSNTFQTNCLLSSHYQTIIPLYIKRCCLWGVGECVLFVPEVMSERWSRSRG